MGIYTPNKPSKIAPDREGKTLLQVMWGELFRATDPDEHEEELGTDLDDYLRYENDPVGFCEKFLHETYTDDIKRVMESVRDYPITIARSGNGTGKTHGAARIAVWWYKSHAEAKIYTAAAPPVTNLTGLLWGEIGSIQEEHPGLFAGDSVTDLKIKRNSKAFVQGLAIPKQGTAAERKAQFSGKHSPNLLFIVDEGDGVPVEVYEAIESCMSGGRARLLIMFNPRAEMGPVYLKERDHQANIVELTAFNHPNVISGKDIYPGAVTREQTVRRIVEWTRPLHDGEISNEECYEVPDFLVGHRAWSMDGQRQYPPLQAGTRKIVLPTFSYMVLARYPAQGENQLISKEWIEAARIRWDMWVAAHGEVPPQGIRPVIGQDVGELGTDESVFLPRWGGYVGQATTWQGVDTDDSSSRIRVLYRSLNAERIFVDGTGVGAGVWAPLNKERDIIAHRVMVASPPTVKLDIGEFNMLRDQLLWMVRDWVRTDTSMLPPDTMLMEEMRLLHYEVGKNGKISVTNKDDFRKVLKRSCDRLDALALTFAPLEPVASKKLITFS